MFINFFIESAQAVSLPTIGGGQDLPAFISSVYSFALTVVGIAVFVQIVRAGFLWLTAAGNVGKAGAAKSMMTNAVIGAILLFAAYMILFTINPDLVKNTFQFNIPRSESPRSAQPETTAQTNGPLQITDTPQNSSNFWNNFGNNALAAGVYLLDVEVTDANGNGCARTFSMEVLPQSLSYKIKNITAKTFLSEPFIAKAQSDCSQVSFSTSFIPDAVEGRQYYAEIWAAGGQLPYIFSVISNQLPPGLIWTTNAPVPPGFAFSTGSGPTSVSSVSPLPLESLAASPVPNTLETPSACYVKYLPERQSCLQEMYNRGGTPYGFNPAGIPPCPSSPGTLCYIESSIVTDPNRVLQDCSVYTKHNIVYCSYSDQRDALFCGMMMSGSFCLPNQIPTTCGAEGCFR